MLASLMVIVVGESIKSYHCLIERALYACLPLMLYLVTDIIIIELSVVTGLSFNLSPLESAVKFTLLALH